MSIVLLGSTSGSITLQEPAVAGTTVLDLPATSGTVSINGPAFRAYITANQTVTTTVGTKVQLNAEDFDTANCFDSTTNYRFTPNVAGYYQFNAMIGANAVTALVYNYIQIFKNGVSNSIAIYPPFASTTSYGQLATLIYMNGTTDYVELYVTVSGTGACVVVGGVGAVSTYMSGFLARAA